MLNEKKLLQVASETDSADIHDRVAEAYYGQMGQQFMRETQNRIHWICRQIQGKSVLDVGCSQGIVPILLAREGLKVIGVDSSPKAIDEANHYLANEPEQVRRNLSFINADFLSWDFDELKIDTVVMSEVLEHLTRPECFLETAARILPKKGRLIVTVPFGINDFIDHKHTFYLLKPLRLISKHFDLVGIEILGKWLGIVADRRTGTDRVIETFHPTIALMEKLESAFYQTERVLRDELSLTRKNQDEASQKYRGATELVATLKQRVAQEEAARQAAEQALRQLEQVPGRLHEERTALQQQLAQLNAEGQAKTVAVHAAEKKLLQLDAELAGVRSRLEEANQKYRGATELATTLKQRVTQEESARQAAEQALAQATTQLEQARNFLQEERAGLLQQVAQLSQQEHASGAAAQEAQKNLLRLDAELAAVRSRLEEANQKYRGATELVATLKQRVTQEEGARQAAEQALAQAATQLEQSQRNLQEERTALQQQLAQLSAEGQAKTVAVHEAGEKLIRLDAELATMRSRVEEANQKYRGATELVTTLKQRVTQEEGARQAAEQALAQAATQLEQSQRNLQEERTALQQQLAQVSQQEQAASATAQEAQTNLLRLDAELETANRQYQNASEQVATLTQRVTQEESARQAAEQALAQATTQLDQTQRSLQEERTTLQQQLAQVTSEGQAKTAAVHEAEEKLLRLDAELTTVRSRLEAANQKYRNSTEQVDTLKQRVTQEEAARQAAEQARVQATSQLEQTQNSLQEERTALQQQLTQLNQQVQAASVAAQEAQTNLLHREAELETANQQYQNAAEQVAALTQQVTQEEAAHQATEQALAQATSQLEQTRHSIQEERTALQQQLTRATAEGQEKTVAVQEAEKKLIRLEAQLEAASQQYRGATEQIAALTLRVTQEEAARQAAEQTRSQAATQLEQARTHLHEERIALQQQLAQLTAESQAKTVAVHEGEKKLIRLEAQLEAIRNRLEETNQQYQKASEQVATLTQRVTQEETAHQAAEQALAQATAQLEQARRNLQEERAALQQQLAQLNAEGQAKTVAVHEAEKKLLRLDTELEAAAQQHQKATEQIATLTQRVTQEETAHQAAEQALAQATAQLEQARRNLQEERAALQQQLAQLNAEGQAKTVAVHEAEKKLLRLDTELEAAAQQHQKATEQIATLTQRVTQEETAHQAAEQALAQATAQLEQARRNLQEERAALQQQLAQLNAEGQAKTVAVHEAEKKLLRLDAELETATQQYRSATEQVAALKQRVTQKEAAHRAAEVALRKVTSQLDQANAKYRQLTGEQIPKLKSRLEQLERTRQQKITAENQLVKTRAAISFQFGYLLIHGFKSVNGFLRLPSALWALRKEAIRRRTKKALVFSPPKLPSSSEPSFTVYRPNTAIEPLPEMAPSVGLANQADTTLPLAAQSAVGSTPNRKLNIACIMDEFTFGSFQPESILHQLTPANWQAELEASNPDMLFIESAWRGKDELWGNKVGHTSTEVQGIVEWCGSKNIPTVFWNKEDPIHFETFLNTAKLFDHVFTTDIDCIHRYKAALGHNRVYLLPFACQPANNNPIETYQRKDAFCFAGAYYVRYPERTRDLGDFVMELPSFRPLEIYDRNYGKNDPNYQFPPEYRQYIVGTLPFDQIDKAYKGYRYAINLNSIKQSQSMFARRVYELLASNTITISNFSRGLRMLFGDLVITTDSGSEIVRRLNRLAGNEEHSRKLRLAGLRKVMREHTYAQRLAYIVSKVSGKALEQTLPHIAVLARATSHYELEVIQANYQRQRYANTSLYMVVSDGIAPPMNGDARIHFLSTEEAEGMAIDRLDTKAELVAGMIAEDYYGPSYLEDIALATRYTHAALIGKAARYTWGNGGFQLKQPDEAYHQVQSLPARAAAIRRHVIARENVLGWVESLGTRQLQVGYGLAIDEFNYCEYGAAADAAQVREIVDDLPGLITGISIDSLLERAERIPPESKSHDDCPRLTGQQLAGDFGKSPSSAITLAVDAESWRVSSTLPDGKHEYLYATTDHSLKGLGVTDQLKVYFDVTPGLNIQLVILFLDAQKQKISHVIKHPNRNQEAVIPPGTDRIRFGLRFYAGGDAEIKALLLGHRNLQPSEIVSQAEHLLLTNHYPSYDDLYRNGFVHTRVLAYQSQGVRCDVFRLRPQEALSYHEFEDVNAITGSQEVLHQMLSSGRYKTLLVHFLDSAMWEVLRHHINHVKVVVWIHGAEIQPWYRRDFNHQTNDERTVAKRKSDERMAFWRELLQPIPANLKLVFVSRYSAEEAMEDLEFRIPQKHYTIIHNPIDTDLFRYERKSADQRKKVLSIRPYASRVYANDLSVKAIQLLSEKPWFKDMEFRMIGDGPLFEETLAPLREFPNVYIEQRFLKQPEIAALHKQYGIFLCPSRMDSQGVSRDEAMSSGLVPITNAVAAIREFVDEKCGILANAEDAEGLASGIAMLHDNPEMFQAFSRAASERVGMQTSSRTIIENELHTFIEIDPSVTLI